MIDEIEIKIKAGNGGNGSVSFRREKYVPFGGPDGGDGGDGGDVIILADPGITSLRMFRRNKLYRAGTGEDGKGRKKHGKQGEDLILKVPVGSIALDSTVAGEVLIADWETPGQQVIVAKGGKGGLGNTRFASSTNQAPQLAEQGEVGEEKSMILELRLIADVGIIGFPNVGKSTLLAAASAAKPKIASYPFTTLEPILGVVEVGQESFVMAEIPGLINDAHLGRGLGHDFLRHSLRTKVFIHLVDGTSASPVEDMMRVNVELGLFDPDLVKKPQLVAVNKIDLPQVQDRLVELKDAFSSTGIPAYFVSATRAEGMTELMDKVMQMLGQLAAEVEAGRKVPGKVFRPQPRTAGVTVSKEGDTLVLVAPELERITARVDMTNLEVRRQFQNRLVRLGGSKALEKAGVKPGDKVRCGDFEWEW